MLYKYCLTDFLNAMCVESYSSGSDVYCGSDHVISFLARFLTTVIVSAAN